MPLETGHYEPATARQVFVWPDHSPDSDGEELWEDQLDGQGRVTGRRTVKDNQGRTLRRSSPPEGFINIPSFDNTDNHVYSTDGRNPWRNAQGEAVGIEPGQAVVIHPDGRSEVLPDEYSQYMFAKRHNPVSQSDAPDVDAPETDAEKQAAKDAADREEFDKWRANRDQHDATGASD